jgi:hypothetical protein
MARKWYTNLEGSPDKDSGKRKGEVEARGWGWGWGGKQEGRRGKKGEWEERKTR